MALHDARTGFHDIKPLPVFTPSAGLSQIQLLVILLIIAAIIIYYFLKRNKNKEQVEKVQIDPEHAALTRLEELKKLLAKNSISVREFSNQLSEILRNYLEMSFNFPALDLTPKEIEDILPRHWKKQLPLLPHKHLQTTLLKLKQIFYQCKWLSFAQNSENVGQNSEADFENLILETQSTISEIAKHITNEENRASGVIAESNLA